MFTKDDTLTEEIRNFVVRVHNQSIRNHNLVNDSSRQVVETLAAFTHALVGAVFLDHGLHISRGVVIALMGENIDLTLKSFKSLRKKHNLK